MSKVADVKPVMEMELRRYRCCLYRMSMSHVKNVMDIAIMKKHLK